MKSYKPVTLSATPEELITMALSEIEEVAQEVSEWRDGMSGTNLENSEKYQMLSEAADLLESVQEPYVDEWPHSDAQVAYTIYLPKRKKRAPSRMMRVSNATAKVAALIDFYESLDDADDHQDIIAQLQEIAEIDVELPGMYG